MTCPDVCQQRLKTLEDHKNECSKDRRDTYKHWEEEVKRMIPQRTFFWLIGVFVLVLVATFGVLYSQGSSTLEMLHGVQLEVVKAQTQLETMDKKATRRDRASAHTRHTDNPSDPQ